jgi:hypothetical protein
MRELVKGCSIRKASEVGIRRHSLLRHSITAAALCAAPAWNEYAALVDKIDDAISCELTGESGG